MTQARSIHLSDNMPARSLASRYASFAQSRETGAMGTSASFETRPDPCNGRHA